MKNEFDYYIRRVVSKIGCGSKMKRQIEEDLLNTLLEKQAIKGVDDPYELLGDPSEVAEEFKENLGIKENMKYGLYLDGFEYISKRSLFGVPLVHINFKRFGVAKGIVAIGAVSIGVISIGAVSIGLVGIGAIALSLLLSMAGMAISLGASIGGLAISVFFSLGGLAIAKYMAVGGLAIGDISIGGVAKGIISVYRQNGTGTYTFKAPADSGLVINAVKKVYPNISSFVVNVIKFFASNLTN